MNNLSRSEVQLHLKRDNNRVVYGTLSFTKDGVIFTLNKEVKLSFWKDWGLIKVDLTSKKAQSDRLFEQLRARLPILLRKASLLDQIEYIVKTGLKTPSDRFYFEKVE